MGGVGSRVVRRPWTLPAWRRASVRLPAVCQLPSGPAMAVSVLGGAPSAPKSNLPRTLAGTDRWGPPVSIDARRAAASGSRSVASAEGAAATGLAAATGSRSVASADQGAAGGLAAATASRSVASADRGAATGVAASRTGGGGAVACAAASRMVCQPVQRQRCAASALSTVVRSDKSAPRRSWPTNRHTMPGVQKPHWVAPQARNASDHRCCSSGLEPAAVVTFRPATRRAGVTQATRGASSTSTVQQPHWPCGLQPSRTASMPRRSRSTPSNVSPSSGTSTVRPSTVNWSDSPVCANRPAGSGSGSSGLDSGLLS